jgi:hypothetical protein
VQGIHPEILGGNSPAKISNGNWEAALAFFLDNLFAEVMMSQDLTASREE